MKITVVTPTIRGKEALAPNAESLKAMTFSPDEFEWLTEESDGTTHDLNAAFNRMLRKAKGELIVFMEDYTKATTNGLIKFWEAYQKEPNVFWTAPLGKTMDWKTIQWDGRAYGDANEIPYKNWEIDWGAAPLKALKEIGGFDEELDKRWSMDNVSVAKRAYLHGYKFKNLFENPAVAFNHDAVMEHPFRKLFDPEFGNKIIESYTMDTKLTYI